MLGHQRCGGFTYIFKWQSGHWGTGRARDTGLGTKGAAGRKAGETVGGEKGSVQPPPELVACPSFLFFLRSEQKAGGGYGSTSLHSVELAELLDALRAMSGGGRAHSAAHVALR